MKRFLAKQQHISPFISKIEDNPSKYIYITWIPNIRITIQKHILLVTEFFQTVLFSNDLNTFGNDGYTNGCRLLPQLVPYIGFSGVFRHSYSVQTLPISALLMMGRRYTVCSRWCEGEYVCCACWTCIAIIARLPIKVNIFNRSYLMIPSRRSCHIDSLSADCFRGYISDSY